MVKKIINGKRYDTETATLVASCGNGLGVSDFRHMSEKICRTKRGNWFTCGSGGPLSIYSQPAYGGGYCGGVDIIRPLTTAEALGWLEANEETEAIEEYFKSNVQDA